MQTESPASTSPAPPSRLIAPWWHTLLIVLLLLGTSLGGAVTVGRSAHTDLHHALSYCVTMLWEWVLAALVYWGLRLRRVPLRSVLGAQETGAGAWVKDAGVALLFWLISLMVLGLCAQLLRPLHVNPDSIRKIVSHLAPTSGLEVVLWIAMSITAGMVEEFIFRGYLQQQFGVLTRNAWAGLICSALMFGVAHGYEGLPGMLLITVYGGLFGVLARIRGNLRPGMMAHAWHDAVSGLALAYFTQHPPHFPLH
ncbi:MAG: CPBP family intramembrane glutamic endopeptidase [Acidobacteriaceae bacterium]